MCLLSNKAGSEMEEEVVLGRLIAPTAMLGTLRAVIETFVETIGVGTLTSFELADRHARPPRGWVRSESIYEQRSIIDVAEGTYGQWHTFSGQLGG